MVLLTTMLISIVEVSNVFAVLVVFLVFCAMVVFILRLHNADYRMTSVTFNPQIPVQQQPMIKICNPFVFTLKPLNDGHQQLIDVICNISSQVPWILQTFWGVSIAELHPALAAPWLTIRNAFMDQEFLSNICLQRGSLQFYSECRDMEVHLSPPSLISPDDFGISPRMKYPLVIVMLRHSDSEEEGHEVAAMVSIVHIRDDLCSMQSCIMAQYLKMTTGQLSTLKPLYVASDEDGSENGQNEASAEVASGAEVSDSKSEVVCVVCRSAPSTRALLPCRHVCTCARCFQHLDKCPMCRSPISSYFCISSEDYTEDEVSDADDHRQPLNWWQRAEQWNDWLNRLMGLT